MGVEKVSDTSVRNLIFTVAGEQPIERSAGPPFDPQKVEITVKNGVVERPWISGPAYRADRKLGKRMVGGYFSKAHAPAWLISIFATEGLEWPR